MSYHNKFGHTQIRDGKVDNLSIGWDYDTDPLDKSERTAVFLFTPWMENTVEHHHISLNRAEAIALRDWLNLFIEDTK